MGEDPKGLSNDEEFWVEVKDVFSDAEITDLTYCIAGWMGMVPDAAPAAFAAGGPDTAARAWKPSPPLVAHLEVPPDQAPGGSGRSGSGAQAKGTSSHGQWNSTMEWFWPQMKQR